MTIKMKSKKLQLNLDILAQQEFPGSMYDIGGLRHYIIIDEKNKGAFLDEVTQDYRITIGSLIEVHKEEE